MTLFLLNTTIKVSLIVAVALIALVSLRRSSAGVRHFVLAAALACAAATPALRLVVPAWQATSAWLPTSRVQLIDRPLSVLDESASSTPSTGGRAAADAGSRAAVVRAFGVVWVAGLVASLAVLAVGLLRLSWLASRARRVTDGPWAEISADLSRTFGLRRTPALLHSAHPSLLVTWGTWRSKVLLPADALDWPADRIRIVLAHELSHVRRGDWLVQMAAEILRSAYWFNPLVWLACRRLRLESERACDDAVLGLGVDGSEYASELVTLARSFRSARQAFVPAAAIARPSSLERRVRAMLNAQLNRDPITRSASIAAALVLTAVAVVVAGFGASAQSQFGSVSGTVSDQAGRTIAGVTIVLSNAAAQEKHELKSDAAGHYEFTGVKPATYELVFEFAGMSALKREGLSVASGQNVGVNALMQIGSVMETITVTDVPEGPRSPALVRDWSGARAAEKADPCATSPNGGCIRPPVKIKDVRPIYPTGVPGSLVIVAGRIDATGRMTGLEVLRSADPALANAALEAVNGWEFLPTHLDGQPVETRMTVTVNFQGAK
ncbi:MAG TPA: M56 family metallopeptidase [Vicinamibacterales bacterium]|nr:M56 family metallopeptidase [Vicinamibacterales bacterium]